MSKKRIGILTSGGDCPGLNAVIRGAVKASHQLGYDCVGFLKGYEGLYDPVQYVHLTTGSTRGILNQGGTILGSTNKGRFAATVGVQDRQEIEPRLLAGVKQTIDQLGITGLVCIGGDGSLAVAQQFHESGIPVVGVPKTIDNDLSATAFTFGFDSAVECATDALDRLHTTAASHERIMVLEVMGRHAGWIALHSGIAGGGDVILIPEIKWNWDHVCHKILHRESQGKKFTLVVVAEGAELPGGSLVGEHRAGAQMKLGGIGRAVCEEIERRLHREVRLSVLGHLQRGGAPTTFDRALATQFGAHAVRLVHEGRFGEMICSQPPEMNSVPIIEAVNVLRRVDPNGGTMQAARALGISFGDRPADETGQNVFSRLEPTWCEVAPPTTHAAGADPDPALIETAADEIDEEFTDDFAETLCGRHETQPASAETPSESLSETPEATDTIDAEQGEVAETPPAFEEFDAETATAEALVESVLDLVAEADEVIHAAEPATPAALEMLDLEANDALEALALEEPAPPTEPERFDDAAQAALAERIAQAAKASRDAAPNAPTVDKATGDLTVAELVKQKLAAAAAAAKPAPPAPAALPQADDPLAEARAALEAALAAK